MNPVRRTTDENSSPMPMWSEQELEALKEIKQRIQESHKIFFNQSDKELTRQLLPSMDHPIPGMLAGAVSAYLLDEATQDLVTKGGLSNAEIWVGMFGGVAAAYVQQKWVESLKKKTRYQAKDLTNLIIGLKLFDLQIERMREIFDAHPRLRGYLNRGDYRKIADIERIGNEIDRKLRREKLKIDNHPERAVDYRERRKQAHNWLIQIERRNVDTSQLAYLTERTDSRSEEVDKGSHPRKVISLESLFRWWPRKKVHTQQDDFRSRNPKLRCKYSIQFLKEVVGGEEGFRYPKNIEKRAKPRFEPIRRSWNNQKMKEKGPNQQILRLLNDIQKIQGKQNRLEWMAPKAKKIQNIPTMVAIALGGTAASELVTGVRDALFGFMPTQYKIPSGIILGYAGYRWQKNSRIQRLADAYDEGKPYASRCVALWLMHRKMMKVRKLLYENKQLGKTLSDKQHESAVNLLDKGDRWAERLDQRIPKNHRVHEQGQESEIDQWENLDSDEVSEFNGELVKAEEYLTKRTDYDFLTPLLGSTKSHEDEEAAKADPMEAIDLVEPIVNGQNDWEESGSLKRKVSIFYHDLGVKEGRAPTLDSFSHLMLTLREDLITHRFIITERAKDRPRSR